MRTLRLDDIIENILEDLKTPGVEYADIRWENKEKEKISIQNYEINNHSNEVTEGIGIRVLYKGAWGFSATNELTEDSIFKTANQAVEIARMSCAVNLVKAKLSPENPYTDEFSSKCLIDPFNLTLEEKISPLKNAIKILKKDKRIITANGYLGFTRHEKKFYNSEGSRIKQNFIISGAGVEAIASDNSQIQLRSYPTNFGGNYSAAGYEFIESLKFEENAEKVQQQALELLKSPECPNEELDLILGSSQLALQIHESCGHPVELDRVMGTEISLAGGSFLTIGKIGQYQYGSDKVTITADSTIPGGLGTFGYDDEGVKANKTCIIDKGIFKRYLSSRETAPYVNTTSSGAMRAADFYNIPLIRMVNVNLEPGDWEFDDLIKDTKNGIYLETNKSWSIDDVRLNFQFGCEAGWRINNGKITGMVKNSVYSGITPEFWNSCDAVCNKHNWQLWGLTNCGKGEPGQTMNVGHGTSPARFKKVKIGVKETS